jgi:hypothetical protein
VLPYIPIMSSIQMRYNNDGSSIITGLCGLW